jgi:hypothetical protein
MYSVKQAAEKLNLTPRAIQLKCKKFKVVKIGNEFQITEELLNQWKNAKNEERNEAEVTTKTSQRSSLNTSQNTSHKSIYITIGIATIITLSIALLFYFNLTNQIETSHLELKEEKKIHYNEVKDLNKRLIDAKDVINTLEVENQRLKDSVKFTLFFKH